MMLSPTLQALHEAHKARRARFASLRSPPPRPPRSYAIPVRPYDPSAILVPRQPEPVKVKPVETPKVEIVAAEIAEPVETVETAPAPEEPKQPRKSQPPNKVRVIQGVVARFYGLPRSAMTCPARHAELVARRSVAMYLSRTLLTGFFGKPISYPVLGRRFHRDHSTIIHAVQMVTERIERDPAYAAEIERVKSLALARLAQMETPHE
jgi:hypothetical protein